MTREDTGKYICEVVGDSSQIAKSEVNLIVQGAAAPRAPLPARPLRGFAVPGPASCPPWRSLSLSPPSCGGSRPGEGRRHHRPALFAHPVPPRREPCRAEPAPTPRSPAVPPSKPVAHVPTSATIGSKAVLRCTETDGSPPPTFRWYRDSMLMPADPKTSLTFRNSSYTLDPTTGELVSAGCSKLGDPPQPSPALLSSLRSHLGL